jgi:hypothetical protein
MDRKKRIQTGYESRNLKEKDLRDYLSKTVHPSIGRCLDEWKELARLKRKD